MLCMLESEIVDGSSPYFRPIGVWALQSPTDLAVAFLPDSAAAAHMVKEVFDRLRLQLVDELNRDFLEYHIETLSPYRGSRGPIFEVPGCRSAVACARSAVNHIVLQWNSGERCWRRPFGDFQQCSEEDYLECVV